MRDEAIRNARDNSLSELKQSSSDIGLCSEHVRVSQKLSEVQAAQKKIRDMELELARIKATYPPEDVSCLLLLDFIPSSPVTTEPRSLVRTAR